MYLTILYGLLLVEVFIDDHIALALWYKEENSASARRLLGFLQATACSDRYVSNNLRTCSDSHRITGNEIQSSYRQYS